MQALKGDQRMPESSPADFSVPSSAEEHSPLNTGVLHSFAQNMAENILVSLVDRRASSSPQGQEALAEELASAVMAAALREACGRRTGEDINASQVEVQSSGPPRHVHREAATKREGRRAESLSSVRGRERDASLDVEMENLSAVSTLQTSRATQPRHLPLSQSGLPVVGSLDYPDAPPPTPLFPELVRSRYSFARKLKGGLAKEFLPSPPPPTPKDKQDGGEAPAGERQADPRLEFMEDLMHSLSAEGGELAWRDDLARVVEGFEREDEIAAYAEALSGDIMDWVTNHQQTEDDRDLHLLANQLAETIITSTLSEVKIAV